MNLNLIPSKAKFQAARIKIRRQVRLIITIFLAMWAVSATILFTLTGIMKVRLNLASENYKKVQQNFVSLQDNVVTSQKLKYRAKMVGGALNNRFEYGTSFETINGLFPPVINLKSYDLYDGGVFQVKGVTTGKDNVDLLETTVETINRGDDDKLKSAKITSLTTSGGVWDFTMELTLR